MASIEDHPTTPERYEVIDLETGEAIDHIAWADEESDRYEVFRTRPRTLSDPPDADLRLYDSEGRPKVDAHEGNIEIVDLAENPLKGPLLALLDDPEVVAKLRRVLEPKSIQAMTGGGMT
jgi:hypothetical protein